MENQKNIVMGLGSTLVAGKGSANIRVQSMVGFHPEHLVIPAYLANDFLITGIKIGSNSQLISAGAKPAAVFAEPYNFVLKLDQIQAEMFVEISVMNQSHSERYFQGCFIGPAL